MVDPILMVDPTPMVNSIPFGGALVYIEIYSLV